MREKGTLSCFCADSRIHWLLVVCALNPLSHPARLPCPSICSTHPNRRGTGPTQQLPDALPTLSLLGDGAPPRSSLPTTLKENDEGLAGSEVWRPVGPEPTASVGTAARWARLGLVSLSPTRPSLSPHSGPLPNSVSGGEQATSCLWAEPSSPWTSTGARSSSASAPTSPGSTGLNFWPEILLNTTAHAASHDISAMSAFTPKSGRRRTQDRQVHTALPSSLGHQLPSVCL